MNDSRTSRLEAWLDRRRDGELSLADQRALEAEFGAEALRREAELQDRIDRALRRLFPVEAHGLPETGAASPSAAPGPQSVGFPQPAQNERAVSGRSVWLRRLALAAVLVAGVYGAWTSWRFLSGGGGEARDDVQLVAIDDYYARKVADGLKPLWLCESDEEFAQTFGYRLGQPLQMQKPPEGVRWTGLDYAPLMSRATITLLAEVKGEPAIVIIDRTSSSEPPLHAADSNLKLHRREIDKLVLYEVSALDEPHLLPLFFVPKSNP